MDRYAIFSYGFTDLPLERDWTLCEQTVRPESSDDHRRSMLDQLFGARNTTFTFKEYNKSDADNYPCTVLAHPEGFILLRIERPKEVNVYDKHESQRGEAARIDKRWVPSFPYIYVVIDCRQGRGCQIAVSIDSNAWRSSDKVAELVQENVNRQLKSLSRGFGIRVKPELMKLDFVSHSRNLIKKKRLSVNRMTIYFTRGMINPKVEEIIKEEPFIKRLLKSMFDAQHGQLTLYDPDVQKILANKARILEHLVTLVGSDPVSEPFRLKMNYSDGSAYSCGKDVRMEFLMDDMTFAAMLGEGSLFPEHEIGAWFDGVTRDIDEQRNAEHSKQDRASADSSLLRK